MHKNVKLSPEMIFNLHHCHNLGSLGADAKIELGVQDIY